LDWWEAELAEQVGRGLETGMVHEKACSAYLVLEFAPAQGLDLVLLDDSLGSSTGSDSPAKSSGCWYQHAA